MTINLDDNKIPFGLLSKEEQEHLHHWPHGVMVWEPATGVWSRTNLAGFYPNYVSRYAVYRTIPASVEPERRTIWVYHCDPVLFHVCGDHSYKKDLVDATDGIAFRIEFDAETGDNPTIVKENFDDR